MPKQLSFWDNEGKLLLNDSKMTIDKDGNKIWRNKAGRLHRISGPAVEYPDGTKYWYQNNKMHRDDGPAIEQAGGNKYWYRNGKRHRNDGPAIERVDGTKEYWINGKRIK